MRYMLLIHQGTTPTPYSPDAWAQLLLRRPDGDNVAPTYSHGTTLDHLPARVHCDNDTIEEQNIYLLKHGTLLIV